MSGKIIVSMTSYPKRIHNVGLAMYCLLELQTVHPDEIHLWLAEPEFPNKEHDLPADLNTMLKLPNVYLHWLPKNTYCHKRHEIFRYTNPEDLVFVVDEDVQYDTHLIEQVIKDHARFPDSVINYNWYSGHFYNGKRILYKNLPAADYSIPRLNVRFFGQSMIPAKVFPKELLSDEMAAIRDECTPICDESWLTPWFVYKGVTMYCEHFGWGNNLSADIDMWGGLVKYTHQKEANGLERRDNWLVNVLTKFPQIRAKYEELFHYGK